VERKWSDSLRSPHEGWGSLPTSLVELGMVNFPKLRKLDGKALQRLKCLAHLERLAEEGLPPFTWLS